MIEGVENAYPNYGLPKQKKYPLPDRKHVLSAIRFFNYVSPRDEKQLAEAILEKIKEFGMKDVGVGPDNRFLKYYKKDADHLEHHVVRDQRMGGSTMTDFKITRSDELMHYRTKGSKNGVRLYQNPDGSLTPLGERHYRDMYGYGRGDSGVNTAIDAKIQRASPIQVTRTASATGSQKSPVRGNFKFPSTSREYNQEMLYNSLGNGSQRTAGGKQTNGVSKTDEYAPYVGITGKSLFSDPKKASSEYLEELNYNSQKNGTSSPSEKKRTEVSSSPKKASSEYLEELNYNSQKNEYPLNGKSNTPQQKESTRNESALKKAYDDASKWVVNRADDVKKGVTDAAVKVGDAAKNAYNDASKWVVDRADDAKKGAADAYNAVSKAVTDTADKVKKGATDGYNSASKAVVDAADEARYAAERAYNSASNAVADAVRAVNDFKENFGPGVADVANAVKEWATTAADDVQKTAGEALDAGKKWVEQAGKDVGDFVNNTVSDVTKAVDDAKKGVTDAANSVGKAAQDGWNWVKGLFGGGKDDYGKDEDKDRSNHSSSSHKM